MEFSQVIKNETNRTVTANGMPALKSTGDALLDLFATAGSMRDRISEIPYKFEMAYQEDALIATKIMFYIRDIRGGGLGERAVFRAFLTYAANNHPECLINNIGYIPYYGRFDDLYALKGTKLESEMISFIKAQLAEDIIAMRKGESVSLLAKWLATPDASSKKTSTLGCWTAKALGITVYEYKRILRALRAYTKIVEVDMSAKKWENINYPNVPSRAMMKYRKAFLKRDNIRFGEYLSKLEKGEVSIKATGLYPYDIVEKMLYRRENSAVLEAQWKALEDYTNGGENNVLVMADVSGSMSGRPMATSLGLAIYFAEHNKGPYHNLFMSFSGNPHFNEIRGLTLSEKLKSIDMDDWEQNTNIEAAFNTILDLAIKNNCSKEEMVKSLVIISDMQFDNATLMISHKCWESRYQPTNWTFYAEMKKKFALAGYDIPNIVFWQVNASKDTHHAFKDCSGVQLFSGQSISTFKLILETIGMNPIEAMLKVINSDYYELITI